MKTIRIYGSGPKLMSGSGRFLRMVYDGEVLGTPGHTDDLYGDDPSRRYVLVEEGGGFDEDADPHKFQVPGTVFRRIRVGSPHVKSITEIDLPE